MLTQRDIETKDWFTHQELNIFLGCELFTQRNILDRWRRSPHPLRIAYRGKPDLFNGVVPEPEILYFINDVLAHLLRDEIPYRETFRQVVHVRMGDPYEGGLQEAVLAPWRDFQEFLDHSLAPVPFVRLESLQGFFDRGLVAAMPDTEEEWVKMVGGDKYQLERARTREFRLAREAHYGT